MFRNYLAAALRNLVRNRLQTFLSVLSLALGLAAALLALLYVNHERSYDRFIDGSDKVSVMSIHFNGSHGDIHGDMTPSYFALWLRSEFPGVNVTRLLPGQLSVRHGDVEATEKISWVDPNFFSLLPLPVLAGDLAKTFERPDAVALTLSMARKYFGRDLPIGETIEFNRSHRREVVAVLADLPETTHLAAAIFASARDRQFGLVELDELPFSGNFNTQVMTYVSGARTSLADLQRAMPEFLQRHLGRLFTEITRDSQASVDLVPLTDLHLHPGEISTLRPHGSRFALTAVAMGGLLIVVAIINFVNLMTGRSVYRAIEVGVRKTSGAAMRHLIVQFLGEAVLYAGFGMILALGLLWALLPVIDGRFAPGLAEEGLSFPVFAAALVLTFILGVLGGLYPALILSSFRPAVVLKGRAKPRGSAALRGVLVSFQFGVLIALIIATSVIYRQTAFSLRDGLRVTHDQVLLIYSPCVGGFADAVRALPGVAELACSRRDPLNYYGFGPATRDDGTTFSIAEGLVGFGFFDLYGLKPIAGRVPDPAGDGSPALPLAVINETALRSFGFASAQAALGRHVRVSTTYGPESEIAGVVPDFAFDLMTMRVPPTIIWTREAQTFASAEYGPVLHVKLSGRDLPETLDAIDGLWRRLGESRPIRRMFLNQQIESFYVQVVRQGILIGGLSAVAVILAGLGLFGLAAFTAERRTKEIGIRKAMGASNANILALILYEFAKPVLWANIIAWPAGYLVMHRWLDGFAYHVNLALWMFVSASALALVIAIMTVLGHALLVSRSQPVTALRYE